MNHLALLIFFLFSDVLITVAVVVCLQERPDTGDVRMMIVMIMTMIEAMTTSTCTGNDEKSLP